MRIGLLRVRMRKKIDIDEPIMFSYSYVSARFVI